MWSLLLLVVSKVLTAYGIPEISIICEDTLSALPEGFLTDATACPSILAALEVQVVEHRGYRMLNVSWAVNIDASINYLKGTWIEINNDRYICKYRPPLTEDNVRGAQQLWFHHLVSTDPGIVAIISVFNVPIPPYGSGDYSKHEMLDIPDDEHSTSVPTVKPTSVKIPPSLPPAIEFTPTNNLLIMCIGCATGLLVLACSITLVKVYRRLSNSPFTELPNSPPVQVLVLVVYPAGSPVFQRAVVAFAEFLKWHEGCHVSIDIWQSRQLAEQGPMHWLAERAMSADRVLVISPQIQSTSFPSSGPTGMNTVQVPAATHDLFPLVLNMVASHARSPSDMAKFWVVQLGKAQEKGGLPVELRGRRGFCLMNDLGKLCRQLRQLQQGSSGAWVRSRPGPGYNEKAAGKLKEAVEKLGVLGKSPQQGGSGRATGKQQAL